MAVFGLGRRAMQARSGMDAPVAGAPPFRANRVTKTYLSGSVTALDDVSFDVHANQVTAMIGPSGCGKTTMLRLMAGLEYPSRGDVTMFGQPIMGPGPERGMVFQAYTSFPWLSTRANIEYGLKLQGLSKAERRERAELFLDLVHLEGFADAYPAELSGGMKQRVSIARTLAQNPALLLLDEPFGALDAQVTWEMEEMIIEIIERENKTVVVVTHDIQEAIYLADRIIFYTRQPGRIKADLPMDFKEGQRFRKKEELLVHPGYVDMERQLYAMMREEIRGRVS